MFQTEYGCWPFTPAECRDDNIFNQNTAVRLARRPTAEIDVGLIGIRLLVFASPECQDWRC